MHIAQMRRSIQIADPHQHRRLREYLFDLNDRRTLLILLDKEVADGDVTDIVHGEAEG